MIRVGTRGSALALWQANAVASRLGEHEIIVITTAGDRGAAGGDKTRWTSELERALLDDEIDIAVHSAKDVPGELAAGTTIAAIPARADPRDAICGSVGIASLESGARIGTSSIRRVAQIRALREDLVTVDIRGNVDTRLRKLNEGQADAIVLAAAGLERIGRADAIGGVLEELVPAPGQGALLVQAREHDTQALAALETVNDSAAERCVMSERALARRLGATCNSPLGALAVPATGMEVTLKAWIGLPDGSHWIADEATGMAEEVAANVAERMTAVGAHELLQHAEELAST